MTSSKGSAADNELHAIGSILTALNGLEGDSIQRVLDYVFSRLSIAAPRHLRSTAATQNSETTVAVPNGGHQLRQPSIRDLKEDKLPESSNQMAALVAYYLSEVLAGDDRKDLINTSDLEKYFKQAGFKLPKSIPQTLQNATAAGYFDAAGNGLYRLNPVGYNLVVHGLPRTHHKPPVSTRKGSRRNASRR